MSQSVCARPIVLVYVNPGAPEATKRVGKLHLICLKVICIGSILIYILLGILMRYLELKNKKMIMVRKMMIQAMMLMMESVGKKVGKEKQQQQQKKIEIKD